ncbi:Fungal protein of unknown function (DUF1752) [Nakaseomyces glabratus]|nr:Fungal protein of unknown function (DUF1752) [Nakaseomyces glabratus]KAH7604864.1 Fungal protein of unknown function (DUF1752) [Nakaseomyces glabratus]
MPSKLGLPRGPDNIPPLELSPGTDSKIPTGNAIKQTITQQHSEQQQKQRQQQHSQNNPNNKQNSGLSKQAISSEFLKVSPNLFTPERLHLFDTVELYTTLIKTSKTIQQGERLGNLSWRILNKALLRNNDINISKKRDGVKNIYSVLNPMNNNGNNKSAATTFGTTTNITSKKPQTSFTQILPKNENTDKRSKITAIRPMEALNGATEPRRNRSNDSFQKNDQHADIRGILSKERQHKSTTALFQKNHNRSENAGNQNDSDFNKSNHLLYKQFNQIKQKKKKEDPQMVITGFDTNMVIIKKKHSSDSPNDKRNKSRSKSPEVLNIGKSNHKRSNSGTSQVSDNNSKSIFKHESLFGKPNRRGSESKHNNNKTRKDNKIFFSSEDEDESDWDSVSDSSEFYTDEIDEEDEDEQYYNKQWDKLVLAKQASNDKKLSAHGSELQDGAHHLEKIQSNNLSQPIRRSLLSGLFHNGSSTYSTKDSGEDSGRSSLFNSQNSTPTSISGQNYKVSSAHKPTIETTNVTAVGSVTPPHDSFMQPSQYIRETLTRSTSNMRSTSRRGSSSSIVSEATGARYLYESNAPPTAHTLLPTALSTHMFVPNNIQQQRMAVKADVNQREGRRLTRRESMDIPIKNVKNSVLKTRMEISEEERYQRSQMQRRHK